MHVSSLNVSRRELSSYFNSPVAYCFMVVFLLVTSGLFMMPFFVAGLCSMRSFFNNLPLILVVFIPAVTMRLWAEERKAGTISLLFSLPMTSSRLVVGKFISALFFCILALAGTLTIPFMLGHLGNPDPGPILGGYVGTILMSSLLLAMGMAISAFFSDQVVAFILALLAGIFCFLSGTQFSSTFLDGWIPGLGSFLRNAVGLGSHFASFQKGVLDLGDILFFLSYTVIFLVINSLALEAYLKRKMARGFIPGIVLLLGIGIFFNATLSNMRLYRMDLTENRIYTLSQGTKRVLERLKVPITVTYYCSSKDKMPTAMKEIQRDVEDILQELSRLSPKFSYRVVDPESLPREKLNELQKKGIVPFNAQTIEQDAVNIKRIYSAISLSYLNKKVEVIPQVVPDSLGSLEYDMVSKVYRLTLTSEPKILLVAPMEQISPQMAMLYQRMGQPVPPGVDRYRTLVRLLESQGYQVLRQEITKDTPIPEDASAIVLLSPRSLNDRQVYEIKRFLHSGKPVFLAAQGYIYRYRQGPNGMEVSAEKVATDSGKLLEGLGVAVDKDMLFDQKHIVLSIESSRQVGLFTAVVQTPVNYPMQIQVFPEQMNQDISITGNLPGLLYLWGSALDVDDKAIEKNGLKKIPLFSSSPESWTRPHHFGPLTSQDLSPPETGMKAYPLALILEGSFPDPAAQGTGTQVARRGKGGPA
ncbi:MAG: hypothetical protein DSZ23_06020 [Thermodesulfatator sp.]|nr:MAG: hypothetical protein DSZ23_06020 [Thermodesulfatator sp.]